jgi:DNA-binding NtrC family response regulator
MEVRVPPLRERREDIPLLLKHFLEKFCRKLKKDISTIAPAVSTLFLYHQWPGNVRELGNTLEHACIRCRANVITADHLPPDFEKHAKGTPLVVGPESLPEAEDIRLALQETRWNKARAADLLGISRRTIYRKIDHFKITRAG